MAKKRVEGKVALITGAAQGIGKAIAILLANEGARVVVSDVNDVEGKAVVREIGGPSMYLRLDVQKENEWKSVVDEIVKKFGKLEILVNNAGITGLEKLPPKRGRDSSTATEQQVPCRKSLDSSANSAVNGRDYARAAVQEGFGPQDPEHASLSSWRQVHAINSDSVFLGCKYAIGAMKRSSGSIVNISSRSGLVGIPGAAAYAASKAAVRNHTKTVALYCCQQEYGIRCNSVHPAAILTPMWEPMLGSGAEREARMAEIAHDIPMRKMGTADDVANAVLFLASDESKYITGIELTVDGGILAGAGAPPKKAE